MTKKLQLFKLGTTERGDLPVIPPFNVNKVTTHVALLDAEWMTPN